MSPESGWRAWLQAVLGVAPHELGVEHLQAAVGNAVREDEDLDFKARLYGNGGSDRRELAA